MTYPKKLISPDGEIVLAKQAVHEAELRAEGYEDAPGEAPAPEQAQEPPSCAACAELQAQVAELQAKLAKAQDAKPPRRAAKG
jgi:hypothetical protein